MADHDTVRLHLGVITDVHVSPEGTPPGRWHNELDFGGAERRLALAVNEHQSAGVDAIAMLGDLTNFGDEASCVRGIAGLAMSERPVLVVPGNHDCLSEVGALARGMVRAVSMATGEGQVIGGVRVAGVTITEVEEDQGLYVMSGVPVDSWGEEPVVVISHFPVISREAEITAAGIRFAGGFVDRGGVLAALQARSGPVVIVHGHLHVRDAVAVGNLLQISCAALIEPPYDMTSLWIEGNEGTLTVEVDHRATMPAPPVWLPLLAPERGRWEYSNGEWGALPITG